MADQTENLTFNLSFRYSESDYVCGLRTHYASVLRLRLDIVVVIQLAGVGGYLWRSPDLRWLGAACMTVAVGFALLLIAAFTLIPRLVFRREPRFRDDYSLAFSSEGIHFRTGHIDSRLQWSVYSRALVGGHSYVLYHGPRAFTVIPKQVFQSQEQRHGFEKLLAEHIPRIVTKAR